MKELFKEIPYLEGEGIILKRVTTADQDRLQELVDSPAVQRHLPTFLFEQQYDDMAYVIDHLYDECLEDSLILGAFEGTSFCGIGEMYGYRAPIHKISVGYRLPERCWGRGIASEALRMMIAYLCEETDIEIITASTMVENQASANVLRKNGFEMVVHAVGEDWGYPAPTIADKWIR